MHTGTAIVDPSAGSSLRAMGARRGVVRVWRWPLVLGLWCCAAPRDAAPPGAAARNPDRPSALGAAPALLPERRLEDSVPISWHDANALTRAPQFELAPQPLAVAGGATADPEFDLTRARAVVLLSDHRIAAYSAYGTQLVVFDSLGRAPRRVVRRGRGPREILGAGTMALLPGDTLLLPDIANQRLNWVTADSGVVRSEPLNGRVTMRQGTVIGSLPGNRLVFTSAGYVRAGAPGLTTRSQAEVLTLATGQTAATGTAVVTSASSGTAARVIAQLPDLEIIEVATKYEGMPGTETMPIGFTRALRLAIWDTLIVSGSGEGYRLERRNADGTLVDAIVVAVPRRAVTPAMHRLQVEATLRERAAYSERPRDPSESDRLIRELPYADSLPAYRELFVTPQRTLWVLDFIAPLDAQWTATAFREDGAIVGRLRGPASAPPVAFGDDRVVLRALDEDGVVSLQVWAIVGANR